MEKFGTIKLPRAIGAIKLPERQVNGSSYTVVVEGDKLFSGGGGDMTRTCNPTIDVLTLTFV
jgi:hypothetical protein